MATQEQIDGIKRCQEAFFATGITISVDYRLQALRRLEVVDFPCFVATDTQGNDVYAQVIEAGSR